VLSGETGAGKSIIVGALGLLLGERANSDMVRPGAARATVEGVFEVADESPMAARAAERGIDIEDGLLVLRREVSAAGRSRAWINDSTVTTGVLAEFGRALVDLHGQHEAQTLLDSSTQRPILDAFAGAGTDASAVSDAHHELGAIRAQIADLTRRKREAERRADYLRHVATEIQDAHLESGEDVRLEDEARRLENADELRALAEGIASGLDGEDESVLPRVAGIARALASLQRIDPSQTRLQELFDSGYYAFESLARELGEYAAQVELDPERLEAVRRRRDLLFRLTKKYGGDIEAVLRTGADARGELQLVDGADLDIRVLETRERDAAERMREAAARLSSARKRASSLLAKAIDQLLPQLGMPEGRFTVVLQALETISATGAEEVHFHVTANAGHDPRPLSRVASGGELSRVMLALKTVLARLDQVPTLVFDEVDAGIGGRVGLQVGDTMRRIAEHHQVLAISHLPQIAARAHHHIVVSKGPRGGVTTADVAVASGEDRIAELARLLGGDPESEASRAHARELLGVAAAVSASSGSTAARAARGARAGPGHR
jgi:DNA repair protein RecN (Recombination protein N)